MTAPTIVHGASVVLMPPSADIFKSDADSLVDPVDCTGAQGAGLAKAFTRYAPDACAFFKRQCPIDVGDLVPVLTLAPCRRGERTMAPLVYFFPTKRHWRQDSRLDDVEAGLRMLTARVIANASNKSSVAIPALGCGYGGLAWSDVMPRIRAAAEPMARAGVRVMIYPPK